MCWVVKKEGRWFLSFTAVMGHHNPNCMGLYWKFHGSPFSHFTLDRRATLGALWNWGTASIGKSHAAASLIQQTYHKEAWVSLRRAWQHPSKIKMNLPDTISSKLDLASGSLNKDFGVKIISCKMGSVRTLTCCHHSQYSGKLFCIQEGIPYSIK